MDILLDRPVWSALTTQHLSLSVGGRLARRYAPEINLFAAAGDETAGAVRALSDLVQPGERVVLLQAPSIVVPRGLVLAKSGKCVQMILRRSMPALQPAETVELTEADAPEMLALAKLTEPGPFLSRTHTMGAFLGVRVGGRLAAMAGERFRFPGFTEVSGVCTHPDFRGQGLARRLSTAVAARIQSRGEQPFLHAWCANLPAIALYESLGFEIRAEVDVKALERPAS